MLSSCITLLLQAIEAPALAASAMEAGVRRSSSLTRDGNTLQPHQHTYNRSSSLNSNTGSQTGTLQKPPSFKEGQTQQQQQPEQPQQEQQDVWAAWRQQFVDAIEYDSKAVGDDGEPEGVMGLVLHFMSIFWKLVNALTPPAWWMGGWPCFWGCLVLIIGEVRRLANDLPYRNLMLCCFC
jgi:hypothetical protein